MQPNEQTVIRIIIAEDQAVVRRGAALLLSMEPDMEVVGQACNGVEAVELARLLEPDVVLMDLHMPLKGGVAATREITESLPGTQILVLTTLDDDDTVFEAVRAGAHAYLLKDAAEDELLETIRALRRGESRLTPQIARKVMEQFARMARLGDAGGPRAAADPASAPGPAAAGRTGLGAPGQEPAGRLTSPMSAAAERAAAAACADPAAAAGPHARRDPADGAGPLTEKEEKILALIAEGLSNRQIAQAVFLAEGTIKNYVSRIMEKLHANTRTELAIRTHRQRRQE